MTARRSTPSSEDPHSESNARKRVCKACDRCRLKKSKCDGASPCSRCRFYNAICVFGKHTQVHNKVYPKGYVEMLEQQQTWLVHGLQELYRRTIGGESWPRDQLKPEPNGRPLTHDMLTCLGVLDHGKGERFEENPEDIQRDVCRSNSSHIQDQGSSARSSDSPQRPTTYSRFLSDAFSSSHCQMLPGPLAYSPITACTPQITKSEPQISSNNYLSMQGANQLALQGSGQQQRQQWTNSPQFSPFDDMAGMTSTDYVNLPFDDEPMFHRLMPLDCNISVDIEDEHEVFDQFLNPNPQAITFIRFPPFAF